MGGSGANESGDGRSDDGSANGERQTDSGDTSPGVGDTRSLGRAPARLVVDNSALRATSRCATEAMLRYGWGWTTREEAAALRAGSAVHAALDVWLDPTLARVADASRRQAAVGAFLAHYAEFARESVPAGDRLALENVQAVVVEWLRSHPVATLPFIVEATERGFAVPLTDAITLVGRLDGIARGRLDGRRWVVEHKTTGRLTGYWTQQWQWSSQITGYVYGASMEFGEPVIGVYVNAIELAKLPSVDNRKCRDHGVSYRECGSQHAKAEITPVQRTPEAIDAWKRDAVKLAERFAALLDRYPSIDTVRDVPMEGTFSNACQFCQFRDFCAGGRTKRSVPLLLTHEPWEPIEGATVGRAA